MAFLLALASALFACGGRKPLGVDYYQYWTAPRLMRSGANIYDTEVRAMPRTDDR